METRDINILKDLYERRKKEKLIIDNELAHIKALIDLQLNLHGNIQSGTIKKHRKVNKKSVVYEACKNMIGEFCSTDIKEVLNNSTDEEIRKITLSYISALLGKFLKDEILIVSKQGAGRGSSNYYSMKKNNEIDNVNENEEIKNP